MSNTNKTPILSDHIIYLPPVIPNTLTSSSPCLFTSLN